MFQNPRSHFQTPAFQKQPSSQRCLPDWFWKAGLASLCLCLSIIVPTQAEPPASSGSMQDVRPALLSTFGNGQRFYLQRDSFQVASPGVLSFNITSQLPASSPNQSPQALSTSNNEINCSTGQVKYPIQSQAVTSGSTLAGPPLPFTLTNRTPLYNLMKEACQEYAQDVPRNW